MTNQEQNTPASDRVLNLMVIEDDAVFRLGLVACLGQFPDLQVLLQADSTAAALKQLQGVRGLQGVSAEKPDLDLVVLSPELGQASAREAIGLHLCQTLATRYPGLPILLLGRLTPAQLTQAVQIGATGYCPKGVDIPELVTAVRRVATGQPYWFEGTLPPALAPIPPRVVAVSVRRTPLEKLRHNLRQSGLQQIDQAIAQLNSQLQHPQLTLLDQLILTGRRRELKASHWLVTRLLPAGAETSQTSIPAPNTSSVKLPQPPAVESTDASTRAQSSPPVLLPSQTAATSPLVAGAGFRTLQTALWDATSAKLQFPLANLTDIPLEIDILKLEKKRELLYVVLRKLEEILDELQFSQVQPEQLLEKQLLILQDLWRTATIDFVGKYYTILVGDRSLEVTELLLLDAEIVQSAILDKIPLVSEFFSHLLFQTPLAIDDTSYNAGTIEAMFRMELLLHNLIIRIACAVMQPLLNRFGNLVPIKQNFYDKRLLSTREIERFRNNLSWRYRMEQYIAEPIAIFESRFYLLTLQEQGIEKTSIYAPRNQELAQLSGIPLAVTLALETRDAIAPRLRSAISFVGSGLVYILTEVIGRGIGLIGRGIVKGIGNALQDPRLHR
jgi:DNA-binding NarL/FixJ family response regulator